MKRAMVYIASVIVLFTAVSTAFAEDFAWTRDFNLQALVDSSGLRARLASRFNIGDLQVKAVLDNFADPSDAYIALRLGELSDRPVDYVIEKYKSNRGAGWGRIAKSLGIKPGSEAFLALKQGQDLYGNGRHHDSEGSRKSGKRKNKKNKGNGKGKRHKK